MKYYNELYHHGILGQRWGIRRYQNEDGSLTKAGKRHLKKLEKKDEKWARKNSDKIMAKAKKQSSKELNEIAYQVLNDPDSRKSDGSIKSQTITEFNKKMASVMNQKVSEMTAPSGRIVQFVAKRGELGVYMALSDPNYDYSQLKNGIYNSGRVAYKKNTIDKLNI